MLLVVDVGNTHTVLGIYKGKELVNHWRVHTEKKTTEDEINVLISNLFAQGGISMRDIRKTVISCVFPPIVMILDAFCQKYFGHAPHWVNSKSYPAMPILTTNPSEVGADRIVNAVAAYQKYRTSLIVIDFGTATTFDVGSPRGEYLGGAICPGVYISSETLFQEASKLPRVEIFLAPECVIGKDTITAIKSGIIYGYAGLVDGMVRRVQKEMNEKTKVIATGGLAHLIYRVSETIESVEPTLTLEGLRIISESD